MPPKPTPAPLPPRKWGPMGDFETSDPHMFNWGGRDPNGPVGGTTKFHYEHAHRNETLNHRNPNQLVLAGNVTYPNL